MTLSTRDTAHVVAALAALLVATHSVGWLFARLRMPRVVGEIVGGVLLGLLPRGDLFPTEGATRPVLGAIYQLGLLLLMFASGMEIRPRLVAGERRTTLFIAIAGTLVPFGAGLGILRIIDAAPLIGTAQHSGALTLVFACAVAVTSIPVIARILTDLKILDTPFARIVLGAAVLEDIALWVVLSMALALAGGSGDELFGLPRLLALEANANRIWHLTVPLAFFAVILAGGGFAFRRAARLGHQLERSNRVAFLLLVLLTVTGLALFLGVSPMFGALLAGAVVGRGSSGGAPDGVDRRAVDRVRDPIVAFSYAFFIPIYFGIVGFRLDLRHHFAPALFFSFLAFAYVVKLLSVLGGALAAGESRRGALNLAVAMNARGGPGIVIASVAYDAGIVSEPFYIVLVLCALVTSLIAGAWLDRVARSERPLR